MHGQLFFDSRIRYECINSLKHFISETSTFTASRGPSFLDTAAPNRPELHRPQKRLTEILTHGAKMVTGRVDITPAEAIP
jgi:hypothetical protein